jgi:hypothetical protein
MKVRNFVSNTSGREVANQFIIEDGNKTVFQSYNSVIAIKENGKVVLDERYWDYSNTTGKYRNQFLGENKKETERKIADGTYALADLN